MFKRITVQVKVTPTNKRNKSIKAAMLAKYTFAPLFENLITCAQSWIQQTEKCAGSTWISG